MTYRLYTEDINRESTRALLNKALPDGFTLFTAKGCWHGACERSLVIEVSGITRKQVIAIANTIKSANHQSAVLVASLVERMHKLV